MQNKHIQMWIGFCRVANSNFARSVEITFGQNYSWQVFIVLPNAHERPLARIECGKLMVKFMLTSFSKVFEATDDDGDNGTKMTIMTATNVSSTNSHSQYAKTNTRINKDS